MIKLILPVALLISVNLGGCFQQPYWVPGLTLPPGATVMQKSETTTTQGMPANIPFMGTVEKTLMVGFDCPGGWSAASAHLDACLKRQGYADSMSGMSSMMGGGTGAGAQAAQMFDGMRMYTKAGSKYTVMLMDMSSIYGGAGGSPPAGMPNMGAIQLSVMKAK